MTEIGEILIEEEVVEPKSPDYEAFLNKPQVEALVKAGFVDKQSIRAASDEDLVGVQGIGAVAVVQLRKWAVPEKLQKGDAISQRCLVFADENGFAVEILPGEIIPAKYNAARCVEKGQAVWSQHGNR